MTDTLTPAIAVAPAETTKPAPAKVVPRKKRMQREEVAETLEALADLLEAGSPEKAALRDMADQYLGTTAGAAFDKAHSLMSQGKRMREALASQDQLFPRVVREMIASAKTTADTVKVLRRSAKHIKSESNVRRDMVVAAMQPAGLSLMVLFILALFTFGIGPMLGGNADVMGPGFDVVLTVISFVFWTAVAFAVGAAVAGGIWWAYWTTSGRKNPSLVARVDRLSLRIPGFGEVFALDVAARFCEVAGSALTTGRTEVQALRAAAAACGNAAIGEYVLQHADKMDGRGQLGKDDKATFAAVADSPLFPWMLGRRLSLTSSLRQRNEVLEKMGEDFRDKSLLALRKTTARMTRRFDNFVLAFTSALSLAIALPVGLSLVQMGSLLG